MENGIHNTIEYETADRQKVVLKANMKILVFYKWYNILQIIFKINLRDTWY